MASMSGLSRGGGMSSQWVKIVYARRPLIASVNRAAVVVLLGYTSRSHLSRRLLSDDYDLSDEGTLSF